MLNKRIVLRAFGFAVVAVIGATVAGVTLHASNADVDRYNAAHMGNPVRSDMPGWNCSGQGCAVRAVRMTVVE